MQTLSTTLPLQSRGHPDRTPALSPNPNPNLNPNPNPNPHPQDSIRLLNEDCEKKKTIIQGFLLDTARDPGESFKSRFHGTPEQFRDLLLHRMEIILQDSIVQNIRLRNQIAQLMTTTGELRQQDKKHKQMIQRCRHVILKLRNQQEKREGPSTMRAPNKDEGVAREDDEGSLIMDAADAMDVNTQDTSTSTSLTDSKIELLDASQAVETKRQPANNTTTTTTTPTTIQEPPPPATAFAPSTQPMPIEPNPQPTLPTPEPVLLVPTPSEPPAVAEIEGVEVGDPDDDGPEVADIPLPTS
mmetsp:Transcript_21951/g.42711  ORF Transcript_21951/g.42711 Transcript_21951/m.42711 type:complete len:299 (+) Transcript_21951:79-975(+)